VARLDKAIKAEYPQVRRIYLEARALAAYREAAAEAV